MRFCFESRKKSKLCLVATRVAPAMVHTDGVLAINGYHERALRTRSCAKSQVVQAELEELRQSYGAFCLLRQFEWEPQRSRPANARL
jgi:hypothetical protein